MTLTATAPDDLAFDYGPDLTGRRLPGTSMPLVLEPAPGMRRDKAFLLEWVSHHGPQIDAALLNHGAILFRGFDIADTPDFAAFVDLFPAYEMGYEAGATSRAAISGKVYEATRVPPDIWIMLHQEMAYMRRYPSRLAFYCRVAPAAGGETIIGDMRRFTAALPDALMDRIAGKGIRYQRNFLSPATRDARTDPAFTHRSWADAFYTSDPSKVEEDCRARSLEFEWLADGSISTWNILPGVVAHPVSGDRLYFSQLHTQTPHRRWMGPERWAQYSQVYRDGVARPFDASYGDGTPLAEEDILAIYAALDDVSVAFPWRNGDIMLLDNLLTAHGRNPFQGERDVEVALIA